LRKISRTSSPAQKPAAGAGQHYGADPVVAFRILQGLGDLAIRPEGASVHHLWPVDGDGRDRLALLKDDVAVGHWRRLLDFSELSQEVETGVKTPRIQEASAGGAQLQRSVLRVCQ